MTTVAQRKPVPREAEPLDCRRKLGTNEKTGNAGWIAKPRKDIRKRARIAVPAVVRSTGHINCGADLDRQLEMQKQFIGQLEKRNRALHCSIFAAQKLNAVATQTQQKVAAVILGTIQQLGDVRERLFPDPSKCVDPLTFNQLSAQMLRLKRCIAGTRGAPLLNADMPKFDIPAEWAHYFPCTDGTTSDEDDSESDSSSDSDSSLSSDSDSDSDSKGKSDGIKATNAAADMPPPKAAS